MMKAVVCVWLGLALAMSGCSQTETETVDGGLAAEDAPALDAASEPTNRLLDRAVKAMQAGRITQPVGDSAVDLFVTLHGREPDNDAVKAALVDLQPYVMLASERAIASGDIEDAERLIGAMAMFNPTAAPLPRLRASLDKLQRKPADVTTVVSDETVAETDAAPPEQPAIPEEAELRPTVADTVATTPATEPSMPPDAPAAALVAAIPPAPAKALPAPTPPPVADEAPPTLVRDVAPEYPLSAMRRGLSGRVRLEFTVRPDGSVADVVVVKATPEGVFDEAAIAAARQWRFEPRDAPATSARELRFDVPRG